MKMKTVISLLAASMAVSSLFASIRSITPVAWKGDVNCWQMKRHNEKMQEILAGGAPVVFIGDSITHFWETHGKDVWKMFFAQGERRAINLGTSADRTEHVIWRITEGKELDGYEAKCIVLMIGTNNTGHFPIEKEPPVDTIYGIKEILRVIQEKQPKARVILTSIFPRGATRDDARRRRNEIVNKEISRFADGKRVIWCDFSDKFLTADGRLSAELFPDLLHPNKRGYEIWASAVVPLIDRILAAKEGESIASLWPSCPMNYLTQGPREARAESFFEKSNWWKTRCLEKRNEIADNQSGEYDIVMVGDSITHRWEREGGEGRALFAEMKKKYRILNLGYGADRTEHAIWRLENGELDGYKAKLFTLTIGTNNRNQGSVEDVAAGIKRILEVIREKHPSAKIVLMPIFPCEASPTAKGRVRNDAINAIIKNYADNVNILWLDFNQRFLQPDGTLTREYMNDLLHPNEKGYQIWLDAMSPILTEVIGK